METISWEVLKRHIVAPFPSILSMGGTRGVRVGYNPIKQELFIRLPTDRETQVPLFSYSELSLEIVSDDTGWVMQISTKTVSLFSEFHRFAEIVTEIFEQPDQTAYSAFDLAICNWQSLVSSKNFLTSDQQLGLYGELIFLLALIQVRGSDSISAWTGRDPIIADRHDFRLDAISLEVKTTRSTQRIHVIHGLGQLQPSLEHSLFILSLRLENAGLGMGKSLADLVKIIRFNLKQEVDQLSKFESKLENAGYKDPDEKHYQDKLILADLPMLIMVDEYCPRITNEIISLSLTPEISGRISDVSYRVNFEGLGQAQGSEFYKNILGDILL